jgi:hypothetical protein
MIILTCQLMFEANGNRLLCSIVYDDKTDKFVKVTQRVSPELVQDLGSANPIIDIYDVINLDYVEFELEDDDVEEVFEMVEEGPQDNDIINKAKEFIISYRRDKKIKNIIEEND